jgi:hypothetical protein
MPLAAAELIAARVMKRRRAECIVMDMISDG